MDFELKDTPEMAKFRREVKGYLKEVIPSSLVTSAYPDDYSEDQYKIRREIGRKLGAKGWLYPFMPKQYGGAELGADEMIVLTEEMEEYELNLVPYGDPGGSMSVPAILVWGTEEQKRHFLPFTTRGEKMTWLTLTEPHGGSDLASAKTIAIRDGDDYVVNGTKTWVGDGHPPDQFWTIVCTDPSAPRHQNLGFLVIPAETPGITIQPFGVLGGDPGGSYNYEGGVVSRHPVKNSIFFEDVRVPAFNLIGGESNGWKVANTVMEVEHGGSGRVGRNRNLERFVHYVKSTSFNGQNLAKDPDTRDRLADIIIDSDVGRLFGLRNFWMRHAKVRGSYEGSQSSYWGKMSAVRIAQRMQEVLGYFAITSDRQWAASEGWAEHLQRNAIQSLHPGGTQDIQRTIIARRMGIGRTVKEEAGRME